MNDLLLQALILPSCQHFRKVFLLFSMLCKNGTAISSLLGLNYTLYCDLDLRGNDLDTPFLVTFQECVDKCTRRLPPCFAATWNSASNVCSLKGRDVTTLDFIDSKNVISALSFAAKGEQPSADIICPFPNLSSQNTRAGMDFKVLCGANLPMDDLYHPSKDTELGMHASSLGECMENCARNHPLCTRVSWVADWRNSLWLNCWLKSGSRGRPVSETGFMVHSAYAIVPSLEKVDCMDNATLMAPDRRVFKMSCNDQRGLHDATALETHHEKTIQDCTNRCASANSTCVAAAFDTGLQAGYENCYLFSTIPSPQERHSDYIFVYLASLSSQFQPPPSKPSAPSHRKWYASIGALGGIMIAIFIWYWFVWRKRKSKRS